MARFKKDIPFIVLAVLTLLFHIYLWKKTGVAEYGDMLRYDAMSMHLALKGYLGFGSGPDAFVTPGYPLFVAFLMKIVFLFHGTNLSHIRLIHEIYFVQQLISIVSLVLIYRIATVMMNRKAGLIASLLSVLYLPMSFVGNMLLTEVLFIPLLLATLYFFLLGKQKDSKRYYALTGLFLGLTTLVRPNVIPLIILFVLIIYWPFMREKKAGLYKMVARSWPMLVAVLIVMLPWWIRNAIDFHHFIPLSTEAGNPLLAGGDPYFQVNINQLIAMSRSLHETQETFAIHYILQGFTHHFFLYAGWFLFGKLGYLFGKPWLYGYLSVFVVYHHVVVFLGFIAMIVGLFLQRLRYLSLTTLLLLLLQLGFLPTARYGYPIIVLWLIILGALLVEMYTWWHARRMRA